MIKRGLLQSFSKSPAQTVQINVLHPPGRSSAPLPVPAPSQEFCITPNVSERQLFSSTFSSALNKSVWSASCIMKAQNHGDGTVCTGQHYQAEGVLGFAFLSGRLIYMEQNQNLPKEVSNSMLEETRSWFQMEMALFEPWGQTQRQWQGTHQQTHQHRKRGRRSSWQIRKDLRLIFFKYCISRPSWLSNIPVMQGLKIS